MDCGITGTLVETSGGVVELLIPPLKRQARLWIYWYPHRNVMQDCGIAGTLTEMSSQIFSSMHATVNLYFIFYYFFGRGLWNS